VLLDYSLSQLQQAQERLGRNGRYIYVAANIYDLPFVPGLFETATMIRVIHHLVEAKSALAQVRQVLRPEGVFILEYANKQNLKAILRYLLRRQSWNPFSPEPIEFVKLNFDFHPRTTRKWLAEVGFSVERQLTVSHFRLGLFKRLLPLRLLVSLDAMVQPTGNWWQLTPSVFVRARAVGDTPIAEPGSLFRCLTCGNPHLQNKGHHLWCPSCHTKWGIHNGIYDFKNPLP
jgi:SAM-dependent methyltransferase